MRSRYGDSPLHLIGHVALFVLAGYGIVQIFNLPDTFRIVVWLVAAVLLHDAVLWPLYSGADAVMRRRLGPAINYVRLPAALSLMLAVAFIATVTGKGESTYESAAGRGWDGYALRWLIVSAVLFIVSAVAYLLRRRQSA